MADQHSLSSHDNLAYLKPAALKASHLGNPLREESRSSTFYSVHSKKKDEILDWKQYQRYSAWNSIRFLAVAIIICIACFQRHHQNAQYASDCCACYYVAQNATKYGLPQHYRLDWSYCTPECVDCQYCFDHYNNSATKAFLGNGTCANSGEYQPSKKKMRWNWDEDCPHELSFSSFKFFLKDYRVYGISTIILVFLYIVLMVSFIYGCKNYGGFNSGASLLIYNVIVSINALYAMFKPMQYYHHKVDPEVTNGATCMVDTINEKMEDVLTVCVYLSFAFIILQWIVGMFGCLVLRKANRINPSQGTVGMVSNQVISYYMTVEKIITVLCALLALLFYATLITASERAISARTDEPWKIAEIVIVDFLCILSVFDIFCCPFCRKTGKNYCSVCRDRKKQQVEDKQPFYQLMGGSPSSDDERKRTFPLQRLEDQAEDDDFEQRHEL